MHAAHEMISLDKALPGMTLSDAILDQQGKILLSEGTILTASTIAALGRHEVAMLPIMLAGVPAPVVDVAAMTARLAYIFRGDDAGTATAILRHCIEDYRLPREVVA